MLELIKKNKYTSMAFGLYINYIVHGMGTVCLAQNKNFLASQWNTDTQVVLAVISALGVGRLLSMPFSGLLSDKIGRKPLTLMGILSYILFFGGMLFAPNAYWGFFFAVVGGIANAFLDTGTYPALIDAFPERSGFASMLVGFAVSWGQFLYPLILAFTVGTGRSAGLSFVVPLIVLIANGFFLRRKNFPTVNESPYEEDEEIKETTNILAIRKIQNKTRGKLSDFFIFPAFSFFCQATSYIVVTWMADYAAHVTGVSAATSNIIMSFYGAGAILCVPLTYILNSRGKSDSSIQLLYSITSFIAVILLLLFPTPIMCAIFAMLIGIAMEGGVMQLVLSLMSKLFPQRKGFCTGIYYSLSGLATFIIPIISGPLAARSIQNVMYADLIFAFITLILSIIIYHRSTSVEKEIEEEIEVIKTGEKA